MSSLFHYTGALGVQGILTEGNFRATHYRFLNDFREGTMLVAKIRDIFRARFLTFARSHQGRWNIEDIQTEFGSIDKLAEKEAEHFTDALFGFHEKLAPTFVVSFCQHTQGPQSSSGLLSQWRGYASGGYCLVFNRDELVALTQEDAKTSTDCSMATGNVDYTNDPNDDILAPFNRVFEDLVPALLRQQNDTQELISRLYEPMVQVVPFVKDGGFSEENEFRFIVQLMDLRKAKADFKPTRTVQYRESNGVLIPYIQLFSTRRELPLEKIIIGPSPNAERRFQGIKSFVEALGINSEIVISEIPYTG